MLELIGTLVTGILSGGATGLIGVGLQRYFDFKAKQQEIEVVRLQLENAKELAKIEGERSTRVAEMDMEARFSEADSRSMVASFQADKASYLDPAAQQRKGFVGGAVVFLMGVVDFCRGILRPGMTAYMCGLVTVMFFWVRELAAQYGLKLTSDQTVQLMTQIISTILYVFTTTSVWWFGARPPKQKGDA